MSEPTGARVGHRFIAVCLTAEERRDAGRPPHDWRALCECGAYSPLLPSDRQRRAWHRQHKGDVLATSGPT